jgi:hypothetical protein
MRQVPQQADGGAALPKTSRSYKQTLGATIFATRAALGRVQLHTQ